MSNAFSEDELYRSSGEFLQDLAENRLVELGGEELRLAAHDIAGAIVDQEYPGVPDDDEFKVSAYIASLWRTVELNEAP